MDLEGCRSPRRTFPSGDSSSAAEEEERCSMVVWRAEKLKSDGDSLPDISPEKEDRVENEIMPPSSLLLLREPDAMRAHSMQGPRRMHQRLRSRLKRAHAVVRGRPRRAKRAEEPFHEGRTRGDRGRLRKAILPLKRISKVDSTAKSDQLPDERKVGDKYPPSKLSDHRGPHFVHEKAELIQRD
ncbi:hypothetical protein B0H13DRAFT_1880197 [Mycena leptocephala]|nr:hypothetical protein B0H13DRAFT_1880197 [Mycena leptocephala]